jgi:hypothetical protein
MKATDGISEQRLTIFFIATEALFALFAIGLYGGVL